MDIKKILKEYQPIIDKKIKELVPTKIDQKWINKYVKKIRWQFEYDSINKGLVNPIWNFLNRGGKRWRPVLLLLCCEIVGGNEKDAIDFVALPELIHNGTLLVDDIEDKSSFRRGKKSLHLIYGEDIAINTGNAMYYLPTL
ncbi:polyprenyl synthetase family protein, partial [Candidatus Woesearchaeota archaeon]